MNVLCALCWGKKALTAVVLRLVEDRGLHPATAVRYLLVELMELTGPCTVIFRKRSNTERSRGGWS